VRRGKLGKRQDHLGWPRQLQLGSCKHLGERRDHHHRQHADGDDDGDDDEAGVTHRRLDPVDGHLVAIKVLIHIEEGFVGAAGQLANPQHRQVQRAEDVGMSGKTGSHVVARIERADDIGQHIAKTHIGGGIAQPRQRLDHRHPGMQQAVHLPRKQDQFIDPGFARLQAVKDRLERVVRLDILTHIDRNHLPLLQLLKHLLDIGSLDSTILNLAGSITSAEVIVRHLSSRSIRRLRGALLPAW